MNVLQIHNFYQQPGGEDTQMRAEAALMKKNGWKVDQYFAHNDELREAGMVKKISAAFSTVWSRHHYNAILERITESRPDICHVHNFFPLISPSVFDACRKAGVPVVMTVHNYRLMCANGLFLRDDQVCEECLSTNMFAGVKYGCYKNSKPMTAVTAAAFEWHHRKNTWNLKIDKLIVLTEFMRDKLIEKGIESGKTVVKPNFTEAPKSTTSVTGDHLLFIGRLDRVKGADIVAELATQKPDLEIRMLGEGVLRDVLEKLPNVTLLGHQPKEVVLKEISNCRAVLLPTRFYEGMPMSIIEAFSLGKPVITANHGALPEMVNHEKTGWLFEPNNINSLTESVNACIEATNQAYMEAACLEAYKANYSPELNFKRLHAIYQSVIDEG